MRTAADVPEAVCDFGGLDANRWNGRRARRVGNGRRGAGRVRLDAGDGETKRIVSAAHVYTFTLEVVIEIVMLMERGREHQAVAEVLVVGEDQLVIEIADDRIGEVGLDPFNQVPVVDA